MKKVRKLLDNPVFNAIFNTFKILFYIIIVLYVIFIVVQRFYKSDINGYYIYTIRTGSMEPAYKVYDVILVKEVPNEELQVGDVITYGKGNNTVTHRIISIMPNEFGEERITTKGDKNETADQTISYDDVVGKVVYKFKIYTFLTRLVNNKVTFFFLIFVPLVVTIFLDIADNIREKELEKEEMNKRRLKKRNKEV